MTEVKKYDPRRHEHEAAEVYATSFTGWPWFEKWTHEDAVNELRAYHGRENAGMFVVEEEGKVVGIGIGYYIPNLEEHNMHYLVGKVPEKAYYLADVAVKPEYRRQGFAKLLVRAREEHAAQLNSPAIFGRTRHDNAPRIKMFERGGYSEIHRTSVVTGGISSERVYYRKRLKQRE